MRLSIILFTALLISCSSATDSDTELDTYWDMTSDSTAMWTGNEIQASGKIDATENPDNVQITLIDYSDSESNEVMLDIEFDESHKLMEEDEFLTVYGFVHVVPIYPDENRLLSKEPWEIINCDWYDCEDNKFELGWVDIRLLIEVHCDESISNIENFGTVDMDERGTIIRYEFEARGLEETIKEITCN